MLLLHKWESNRRVSITPNENSFFFSPRYFFCWNLNGAVNNARNIWTEVENVDQYSILLYMVAGRPCCNALKGIQRHWLFVSIYLIQLSGSPSQSVLHRKRSHDSHPIGGVRAKPFSKQFVFGTRITAHRKIVTIAVAMAVAKLLRCEQIIFAMCVFVWDQLQRLPERGERWKKSNE